MKLQGKRSLVVVVLLLMVSRCVWLFYFYSFCIFLSSDCYMADGQTISLFYCFLFFFLRKGLVV